MCEPHADPSNALPNVDEPPVLVGDVPDSSGLATAVDDLRLAGNAVRARRVRVKKPVPPHATGVMLTAASTFVGSLAYYNGHLTLTYTAFAVAWGGLVYEAFVFWEPLKRLSAWLRRLVLYGSSVVAFPLVVVWLSAVQTTHDEANSRMQSAAVAEATATAAHTLGETFFSDAALWQARAKSTGSSADARTLETLSEVRLYESGRALESKTLCGSLQDERGRLRQDDDDFGSVFASRLSRAASDTIHSASAAVRLAGKNLRRRTICPADVQRLARTIMSEDGAPTWRHGR